MKMIINFFMALTLLAVFSTKQISANVDTAISSTPKYLSCTLGKISDSSGKFFDYELSITGIKPQYSPITPVAFLFKRINDRAFNIVNADVVKLYELNGDLLIQGEKTKLLVKNIFNNLSYVIVSVIEFKSEDFEFEKEIVCEPNLHTIYDILESFKN